MDHCVSFDGQGFSDIAARQGKIQNHNVDYDYVNILLNDVGDTTFYKGQDIGEGGFLENHCPNTFMKFDSDGHFSMEVNPNGQSEEMKALDNFLNGYLRSMPDADRTQALELVNALMEDALSLNSDTSSQEMLDTFMSTLTDTQYADDLAYLLAYTIKYEQENPERAEHVKGVLGKFGMEDFAQYVDIATEIVNFSYTIEGPLGISYTLTFENILGIALGTAGALEGVAYYLNTITGSNIDPNWVLNLLSDYIFNKNGMRLEGKQLRKLLGIVSMVYVDLGNISVHQNGDDLVILSVGAALKGSGVFYVDPEHLISNVDMLNQVAKSLASIAEDVEINTGKLNFELSAKNSINVCLKLLVYYIHQMENMIANMSSGLQDISQVYMNTEQDIISSFNYSGLFQHAHQAISHIPPVIR